MSFVRLTPILLHSPPSLQSPIWVLSPPQSPPQSYVYFRFPQILLLQLLQPLSQSKANLYDNYFPESFYHSFKSQRTSLRNLFSKFLNPLSAFSLRMKAHLLQFQQLLLLLYQLQPKLQSSTFLEKSLKSKVRMSCLFSQK